MAENPAVEVVRRVFQAFDEGRIEDVLALVHPDAVFEPMTRPGRTFYRGHEGLLAMTRDLRNAPNRGRVQFDEFIELEDGRVEARGRQILTTDGGDILGPRVAPILTVQDGLVVHLDSWDPDGADRAPEASPRARMDDSSAP